MKALARGGVVVLENLRFNAGETSKDAAEREAFAAKLAEFGDFFIGLQLPLSEIFRRLCLHG